MAKTLESLLVGNDFTGGYQSNPAKKAAWFGLPLYTDVKYQAGGAYQKLNFNGLSDKTKDRYITKLLDKIGSKLYGGLIGEIEPAITRAGDTITAEYKIRNTTFAEGLLYPYAERTVKVTIKNDGTIQIAYAAPKAPKAVANADAARLYSALLSKKYMFVTPQAGTPTPGPADTPTTPPAPANPDPEAPQILDKKSWLNFGIQQGYIAPRAAGG